MKKSLFCLVMLILPFCLVEAKELEINKLSIEGEEISLESGIYEYDMSIDTAYSNISVYVVVDEGITYSVSGNEDIKVGNNIITIDLTDGTNKNQYKINVLKMSDNLVELSNNNKLNNISIPKYHLGFEPDKLEYNLTIGSEAKLNISYSKQNEKSEVYIEGNEGLVDGSVIKIKVVAQSGDVREYKINITTTAKRDKIEVYEEETYDAKLITYIVTASVIILFLIIINTVGGKKEKQV